MIIKNTIDHIIPRLGERSGVKKKVGSGEQLCPLFDFLITNNKRNKNLKYKKCCDTNSNAYDNNFDKSI
jgi:hypothetical protein